MQTPNDLSRSLTVLKQDSALIAVIEMGCSHSEGITMLGRVPILARDDQHRTSPISQVSPITQPLRERPVFSVEL
jgi:hypothetical protein